MVDRQAGRQTERKKGRKKGRKEERKEGRKEDFMYKDTAFLRKRNSAEGRKSVR